MWKTICVANIVQRCSTRKMRSQDYTRWRDCLAEDAGKPSSKAAAGSGIVPALNALQKGGEHGAAGLRAGDKAPVDLVEIMRITLPRQREGRRLSIADYFLPKSSGKIDVIGMSVVTIGDRASHE